MSFPSPLAMGTVGEAALSHGGTLLKKVKNRVTTRCATSQTRDTVMLSQRSARLGRRGALLALPSSVLLSAAEELLGAPRLRVGPVSLRRPCRAAYTPHAQIFCFFELRRRVWYTSCMSVVNVRHCNARFLSLNIYIRDESRLESMLKQSAQSSQTCCAKRS